jgi:hypothetical protein
MVDIDLIVSPTGRPIATFRDPIGQVPQPHGNAW